MYWPAVCRGGVPINEYISLLAIVIAAFLLPLATRRLGIPTVVGEILFGIMLGIANFASLRLFDVGLIADTGTVALLASLGFIFLMFMAGLEIDVSRIAESGARMLAGSAALLVSVLALSCGFAYAITELLLDGADSWFLIALMLSTTSVGVVVATMKEFGLTQRPFGQSVLISAMVLDVGTMVLLAMYITLGTGNIEARVFVAQFVAILLVFVGLIAAYRVGSELIWRYPSFIKRFFRADDPNELGMRFSLVVVLVFVVVASTGNEAVAILGAFLAGVAMTVLFREGAVLTAKLSGISYGFLIPLFFISIGLGIDYEAMLDWRVLVLIPTLVVVAFVVKLLPSIFEFQNVRNAWKKRLSKGAILVSNMSLIVAAAEIGRREGLISPVTQGAVLALAVISCVVAPLVFKRIWGDSGG